MYDSIYEKNYRKIWESYNGPIPIDEYGRTFEIHHIDGNRQNNDIQNLLCLSIEDHFKIHYEQEDHSACFKIAERLMLSSEERSSLQSKLMKKQWEDDKFRTKMIAIHKQRFANMSAEEKKRYGDSSRGLKRDPVAYKIGAAKRLSDPDFTNKLSKACKGKRKIIECPHCGLKGGGGNMKRYHFSNCTQSEVRF